MKQPLEFLIIIEVLKMWFRCTICLLPFFGLVLAYMLERLEDAINRRKNR